MMQWKTASTNPPKMNHNTFITTAKQPEAEEVAANTKRQKKAQERWPLLSVGEPQWERQAGVGLRTDDLLSKREQREHSQFEDLNTERNANDRQAEREAENDVQQEEDESSENNPNERKWHLKKTVEKIKNGNFR